MATKPKTKPAVEAPSRLIDTGGTAPALVSGLTFKEVGTSGLRAFSGYVREEFLPELQGRQGARVFREMQDNSPIVGAVLFAILGTMRKVDWRLEPADDSAQAREAAEFADSLRFDMAGTWEDFIAEALSMLTFGYAPHEIVYKKRNGFRPYGSTTPSSKFDDGLIGWRKLPIRGQDTVIKWFFGNNGEVLGLQQQPYTGPLLDVPMEKLLLFRPLSHKSNPEGRSILRNAYRPYIYIKRLEELEAINIERMGGLPVLRVPNQLLEQAGAGNAQAAQTLAQYKSIVTNVRVDEQMGLVIPSDPWPGMNGPSAVPMYDFKLETAQGGGKTSGDANIAITRHKVDILTSVLCDFIEMGHTSRGAQNLAETKVDMFMQSLEGWLNSIASTLNLHALPRLWALNGMDPDITPSFVPDMAQRVDLDAFSKFVLSMSQAGMPLFPDPDLEEYVRDISGMPDAPEGDDYERIVQERSGVMDANDALDDTMDGEAQTGGGQSAPPKATPANKAKAERRHRLRKNVALNLMQAMLKQKRT